MKTTDPPVKVLLADGIHEAGAGAMEQLPLIHLLPFISLLHLPFLPKIAEGCMLGQRVLVTKHSLLNPWKCICQDNRSLMQPD